MKPQILGVALLGVAFLAGQARAGLLETINFDTLGPAVSVTNQFANVVFSAGGADLVLTTAQNPPYLGSPPNLICTGTITPSAIDCTQDIMLVFSTPVDNITFNAFGNATTAPGQFAFADVYQGTVASPVLSHPNIPLDVSHTTHCGVPGDVVRDCAADPQSLAFTGITILRIHGNTDPAGTAYDDFVFTVETSGTIPEPSTLLLTGFCGIVWAGRRFLARKA